MLTGSSKWRERLEERGQAGGTLVAKDPEKRGRDASHSPDRNLPEEEEKRLRTQVSAEEVVRALTASVKWEGQGLLIGVGQWVGKVSKLKELKWLLAWVHILDVQEKPCISAPFFLAFFFSSFHFLLSLSVFVQNYFI